MYTFHAQKNRMSDISLKRNHKINKQPLETERQFNVKNTEKRPVAFLRRKQSMDPAIIERTDLLKKNSKVFKLIGCEPRTKWIVLACVMLQITIACISKNLSRVPFFLSVYVLGATLNQSLFLAIHEISHNLAFKSPFANRMLSVFANLPIGIPYAIVFRHYHLAHHRDFGIQGIDTDLPSQWESWIVSRTATSKIDHAFRKLIFMAFHVLSYALRPLLVNQTLFPINQWVVFNFIAQGAFNATIVHSVGWKPLIYLISSTFVAGSLLHPCSSHFLAEHYTSDQNIETYSHYGFLNRLTFNVGYHREHHVLPGVPWSNLPKLREIIDTEISPAPQRPSWCNLLLDFLTDDSFTLYNRVCSE